MQLFPGVQTDFGLTNSLGIRTDIQGPAVGEEFHEITAEEMFNVLPFDNTITTMFLSGREVQELFDYVSFRSAGRGCNAQAQVSSARFVMDCANEVAVDVTVGGSWDACGIDADCATAGEICVGGAGGRPLQVLESNTTQIDSGLSMRIAVEAFMDQLSGDDPEFALNDLYRAGDGRITPRF